MFYSHCLLTKNGGSLKPIWTAAYFHKRLKKDQVSETDIASSVDEILLNEVHVTYRVLGYLLLGVVRIYSKKVEYLHKECNEVLIKINTFVPSQKASAVKKTICAQYQSITLPERFELDAFVLDIPENLSRDSMETNQRISLEETSEAAGNEHDTMNLHHHEEEMARFGTSSDFCASLQSLHRELFCFTMDFDTRVNMSSSSLLLEANMERFENDQLHEVECPENEMDCRTGEPLNLGAQATEVHSTSSDFHTPPHNDWCNFTMNVDMGINMSITPPLEESMERVQDDELHEEYPQHEMECGAEEPLNLGVQSTLSHSQDNQMKLLKITPPDPGDSDVFSEGHPVATTAVGTPDLCKLPHDSGAAIPEFMVIKTPASREKRRSSKKRKSVFDNMIVLPNEVFKKNIYDSSSLVVKRRTVPHSALDAWKACKISNLHQDFLEPLIPCSSLWIRDLFYGRSIITPEPAGDAEGACLELEASPVKDTYDCAASVCFVETPTTKESDRARPMTSSTSGGAMMHTFERPDICLNLMDEEVCSREEDSGRQDGLTVRTRKLARHLRDSFLNLKDRGDSGLSLEKALEGKTRKESARLFYEVLVLKSRGFIDVKQDTPYGNILVESTPQLETI